VSIAVISDYMVEKHSEHDMRNDKCVLCVRFGPAIAGEQEEIYPGRMVSYSIPVSADPDEW
jgi:hypothetical protein